MDTAQILSICCFILGVLLIIGGYYLILLDKIQKNQKAGISSDALKAIPDIIKAIAELVDKPGGLGLIVLIVGVALVFYGISWWLDPGMISKILTSNSSV